MITRVIKGIHNGYPPLPHYAKIWDINQVLEHYNKLPENSLLSLKELTHKLVLLLMILGHDVSSHSFKSTLTPSKSHTLKWYYCHTHSNNIQSQAGQSSQ